MPSLSDAFNLDKIMFPWQPPRCAHPEWEAHMSASTGIAWYRCRDCNRVVHL